MGKQKLEAPNRFELMVRQLQCRALPLGYRAVHINTKMLIHYSKTFKKSQTVKCFFTFFGTLVLTVLIFDV